MGGTRPRGSRRQRFHWNRWKAAFVRGAERSAAALPEPVARVLLRAGALVALAVYFVPGVPLRGACRDLARLAEARGHAQRPFAIYRRLVAQMLGVARLYHRLYREGRAPVLACAPMRPEERRAFASLFEQDGAFVIAVAHNVGAVLYAMRFAEEFPCLVVGKRSKAAASNELLLRFFARLGAELVLASRHERVAFTRRLLGALDEGRAIIAPFDRIDRSRAGLPARIFDQEVSMPPWAVRIAARRKLAILPVGLRVEDGQVQLELGAPIREADPARALQDALSRLEGWILRDPGSWAFLADKRWRQVLARTRRV
jgi:lauroyl/myristoyl acyltransferase